MLTGQAHTLQDPMVQTLNPDAEEGYFPASESGHSGSRLPSREGSTVSPAYQDATTCGSSSLRWKSGRLVGLPGQTPLIRMPGSGYSQPGPSGRVLADSVISSASTASTASTASSLDSLDGLDGLDSLDSLDGLDGLDSYSFCTRLCNRKRKPAS